MIKVARYSFLLIAFGLSGAALADIELTPADCNEGVNCWTSNDPAQPDADAIETLVGEDDDLTAQYKSNVGGSDEGPFADDYNTTYFNTPGDPQDATITWAEGGVIDCLTTSCYLSVKDGKNTPSLYVFDISGWDGLMDIILTGFWPDDGAISNVAIWSGGNGTDVPEPGTLGLLGLGLFGLGLSRRRAAK